MAYNFSNLIDRIINPVDGDDIADADYSKLYKAINAHAKAVSAFVGELRKLEGKAFESAVRSLASSWKLETGNSVLRFDDACQHTEAIHEHAKEVQAVIRDTMNGRNRVRSEFDGVRQDATSYKILSQLMTACANLQNGNRFIAEAIASLPVQTVASAV